MPYEVIKNLFDDMSENIMRDCRHVKYKGLTIDYDITPELCKQRIVKRLERLYLLVQRKEI